MLQVSQFEEASLQLHSLVRTVVFMAFVLLMSELTVQYWGGEPEVKMTSFLPLNVDY